MVTVVRFGRAERLRRLFAVAIALWLVAACSGTGGAAQAPSIPLATPGGAWYPSDFMPMTQDTSVAFRWMTKSELQGACSEYDAACWGLYVVPRDGCGYLYVELSVLDGTGTAIGYTNAVGSGVQPGQRARLIFDSFDKAASKARISKVSCF